MAVTLTVGQLAARTRFAVTTDLAGVHPGDVAILTNALASATAIVETRAPAAPSEVQDLAVTNLASYWLDAPIAAPARFGYNAYQHSGAAALLAPYIVRRAEAV